MRDSLTVIAGIVLLVLVAALAAPAFVDWNQHRAVIDAQISRSAGVEVVTTGPIRLTLLPSPRIGISGLRAGDADPAGTRLTAQDLRAELELTALLRGEVRISDITLDGVDVSIATRGSTLRLPASYKTVTTTGSIARLGISRGRGRLIDETGAETLMVAFALQAQQVAPLGPWRIEGEVARRSVRVVTGDRDSAGRVRAKFNLTDGPLRGEFDGWIGLSGIRDAMRPSLTGTVQAIWPGQGDAQPGLSVTAQVEVGADGDRLRTLTVESPGAGRLEGEAALIDGSIQVSLRGRRFDIGVWQEQMAGDGFGTDVRQRWTQIAARIASLNLAVEQLAFRGEELSDVETRLMRGGAGWRVTDGRARFAGASLLASSDADALSLTFDSPDLRRIALALQRLGLPAATASDLGSLGDLRLAARLRDADDGWLVETWQAQGRFGQARGTAGARIGASGSTIAARIDGADLLALLRPGAALASLAPGALALRLDAVEARLGSSPPGRAAVNLARREGAWSLMSAEASGFDGVSVTTRRDGGQDGLRLTIAADRADALAAVGERLTDIQGAARMLRALRGISPIRAEGSVTPTGANWTARVAGSAGPLVFEADVAIGPDGKPGDGRLTLTAADRGVLFRALGLPPPGRRNASATLSAIIRNDALALALAGQDGLRAEVAPLPGGQAFSLAVSGPAEGLLPASLGSAGAGALTGQATVRLRDGAILLEGISGQAAGAAFSGEITVHGPDRIEGRLNLPAFDTVAIAREAVGERAATAATAAGGSWSGDRFAAADNALNLDLALRSDSITLPGGGPMQGSARLQRDAAGLRVTDIALSRADVKVSGSIEVDITGSERAARLKLDIRSVDLSSLGPDFAGQADIALQAGAFGDSMARLAASLNGSGEVTFRNAAILRFDPVALERIAANTQADIIVTDAPQLAQNVRRAVETTRWPLSDRTASFLIAGGVARLGVFIDDKPRATGAFNGFWDARSGQGELRAAVALKSAPAGWTGAPPQLALNWRGPWRQMQRSYDVSALANALSLTALQREIARVEAFEAEIRERIEANRRLRAEEEARRQAEADAAAARETQPPAPDTSVAPPLPPPIMINPVAPPLSRQPARAN